MRCWRCGREILPLELVLNELRCSNCGEFQTEWKSELLNWFARLERYDDDDRFFAKCSALIKEKGRAAIAEIKPQLIEFAKALLRAKIGNCPWRIREYGRLLRWLDRFE